VYHCRAAEGDSQRGVQGPAAGPPIWPDSAGRYDTVPTRALNPSLQDMHAVCPQWRNMLQLQGGRGACVFVTLPTCNVGHVMYTKWSVYLTVYTP
jgi:hypothetical protein